MKQNNNINLKEIILQQFLSLEKDAKKQKQFGKILDIEDKVMDGLNKHDKKYFIELFKLYKKEKRETLEEAISFTIDFVRSLHN